MAADQRRRAALTPVLAAHKQPLSLQRTVGRVTMVMAVSGAGTALFPRPALKNPKIYTSLILTLKIEVAKLR